MSDTITIRIEKSGETSVELDREEYEQAKADGEIDHLLDVYASDIETEITVTEPDGTTIHPFG